MMDRMTAENRARALHAWCFASERAREPRSPEYRDGVLAALMKLAGAVESTPCPFPQGSAQRDAWYAGYAEGRAVWRDANDAA